MLTHQHQHAATKTDAMKHTQTQLPCRSKDRAEVEAVLPVASSTVAGETLLKQRGHC